MRHEAAALRRRRVRLAAHLTPMPLPGLPAAPPDVLDVLQRAEQARCIQEAMHELRPPCLTQVTHRVLTLCGVEGYRPAQAAQILHLTPRQVSARLSRAVSKLKQRLADRE